MGIIRFWLLLLTAVLGVFFGYAQQEERTLLRGQVMHRNVPVQDENVINAATETATITGNQGEFTIAVKAGDQLLFSSINFQLEIITVTEEILENNRLVVEVTEKVTELDEVVVSAEEQKELLRLRNEEFKGFDYEIDRSTEVDNVALSDIDRGGMQHGLNFVNIFKALSKAVQKDSPEQKTVLKPSAVLRQVYDDRFFVEDLGIPQGQIDEFLYYCDDHMPAESLFGSEKTSEFELIDFLVKRSDAFLKQTGTGN